MRILAVGFGLDQYFVQDNVTYSSFGDSTPFGYDLLVVNTADQAKIVGTGYGYGTIWDRWQDYLNRWMAPSHKIIVTINPKTSSNTHSNYNWIQLPGFYDTFIVASGDNTFLGSIVATDSYTKQFLRTNESTLHQVATYRNDPTRANTSNIHINSKLDDELVTSFTWKSGGKEVIFVPSTDSTHLSQLLSALDTNSNKWKIDEVAGIEEQINILDSEIEEKVTAKQVLYNKVSELNQAITSLIDDDIYLRRSIHSFELTQGIENPDPINFYESVEAIENAFNSEAEMREKLGVSRTLVNTIMRRANDFRHVAKSGESPASLTQQEIQDFTEKCEAIIKAYITYLRSTE